MGVVCKPQATSSTISSRAYLFAELPNQEVSQMPVLFKEEESDSKRRCRSLEKTHKLTSVWRFRDGKSVLWKSSPPGRLG